MWEYDWWNSSVLRCCMTMETECLNSCARSTLTSAQHCSMNYSYMQVSHFHGNTKWQRKKKSHTELINFSESEQCEPKLFACRVMFSFVWESNVGFSIRALRNTQTWFFTYNTPAHQQCMTSTQGKIKTVRNLKLINTNQKSKSRKQLLLMGSNMPTGESVLSTEQFFRKRYRKPSKKHSRIQTRYQVTF